MKQPNKIFQSGDISLEFILVKMLNKPVEKPYSKWFTGCVLFIIGSVGGVFLFGYPFRSGNALKVSFISITNDASLGPVAVFGATNASPENVNFLPAALQTKSHGAWISVTHVAKDVSLPGHTYVSFTVALPKNHATWRQPVYWCYENSGALESIRGNVEANVYFNWQNLIQDGGCIISTA